MSSNQFIEDNLTGHQIFVQRYANGVSRDITKGLKKLAKEIENKIKAGGGTLTVGQMSRLQNDLGELIKAIGLSEQIAQAGQEFTESEVEYFGNLLQRGTSATTITRIAPESLYATLSETPMLLTSTSGTVTSMTISQMVDRFDDKIASDIMNRVRLGMIDGESVKKIARDVNRIVTTRTRRQTEAVVRTIINHVGNEARSYAANANREILQGERYTATLDSRTTLLCASLDGEIFKIGEGPQPPLHFNCRSVRVPLVKDKYKIPGLTGERGAVGQNKDGTVSRGTVSSRTTYQSWLRRQPADFQDKVLGKERATLFRNGSFTLDRFVDSSGATITLDQLRNDDGILLNSRGTTQ